NFPAKSGGQMVAIKTMIDRVVSGNAAAPFTCTQWTASIVSNVSGGRAYVAGGNVYAVNSNQYLGYYAAWAFTTVRRTSAGYYAYGSCACTKHRHNDDRSAPGERRRRKHDAIERNRDPARRLGSAR